MSLDRFQRPAAAARALGAFAEESSALLQKRVLLTGDAETLCAENGRLCLLDSLRLLVRMAVRVDVALPRSNGGLIEELTGLAAHIADPGQVRLVGGTSDDYDAVLFVGGKVRAGLPWTAINSNGWVARVSSGPSAIAEDVGQTNPIAALAAACLGAGEVFKRLVGLRPERGRLLNALSFSLHSLSTEDTSPGPPTPERISLDLMLIGAGAIGNGVGLLLSQFPVTGRVTVVDHDFYEPPNLGTCLLVGREDLGASKAEQVAQVIGTHVATPFNRRIEVMRELLGKELPFPRVVLTALDSIPARQEAQDLWPDVLIDGATGQFLAQVSRHPFGLDIACLRCVLREPSVRAEEVQARATGIREQRLRDLQSNLTEKDVSDAPKEKRAWLEARVGQRLCGIVEEALLRDPSTSAVEGDATITVPFVPALSACMVVAELMKDACGWSSSLEPRFQMDCLQGPASGLAFPEGRRAACTCTERSETIREWRKRRTTAQVG